MSKAFTKWRDELLASGSIAPLAIGASQEEVTALFGSPDYTSAVKKKGKALVFRYTDIEFHFDQQHDNRLFLIYGESESGSPRISMRADPDG